MNYNYSAAPFFGKVPVSLACVGEVRVNLDFDWMILAGSLCEDGPSNFANGETTMAAEVVESSSEQIAAASEDGSTDDDVRYLSRPPVEPSFLHHPL